MVLGFAYIVHISKIILCTDNYLSFFNELNIISINSILTFILVAMPLHTVIGVSDENILEVKLFFFHRQFF